MTTTREIVVVTDHTLTADLHVLNAEAKAMSRRGFTGMWRDEYAAKHDEINDALTELGL